jgi:hypothetical protein
MRRACCLLVAFFSAAPVIQTAAAQVPPSVAVPADAIAHFDRGTVFYTEGDYAAALIEFKRAYDTSPNWQVLFNIGQSYFQLRDYAHALITLQRFAVEGGDHIGQEDRRTLEAELPDLANRVGRVTVACNLDGATVSVDDLAVGTTPLRGPLLVSAGSRMITASYEGRTPVQRRLAIGGGDLIAVRLDFTRAAPVERPISEPVVDRRAPSTRSDSAAYLGFLFAGGGLAVGSVFGVMAINDKSSLDRVCTPAGACPTGSHSDISSLARNGIVSTVGFGVGIGSLVVAIAFWVEAHPASARAVSSLRFGPGSVAGSF